MKSRFIAGIVVLVIGVVMLIVSHYIMTQVSEGKIKVSNAQESVNQGKSLFSVNPVTKQVGKGLTSGAQKKIDEGKNQIQQYEELSSWLKIGGIAVVIIGFVVMFTAKKKRR